MRTGRRSIIASRRFSRNAVQIPLRWGTETGGPNYQDCKASVATLAQMGTALARLSDAALEIKQNRIAAYESCGFAFPNAYADELACGAERKRRQLQKARDRAFMSRQTETSIFWPLVASR